MNNKISVIVPVYNAEKGLNICLDSLKKQTYKNFEVILINDGSTDKSGDICDIYTKKDDRFKVVHSKNSGVSSARNKGLDICTGDYIIFVDSDDEVKNNMLEEMLYYLLQSEADVIITGITFVKDGKKVKDMLPPKHGRFDLDIWEYICKDNSGMFGYVSNKMYKSYIIKGNQIRFDEDKKIQEDLDFALSVYSNCSSFYMLDRSYYLYNQEEKNRVKEPLTYMQIEVKKRDILIDLGIYDKYKSLHCEKLASMIFGYLYWLPKNKIIFLKEIEKIYSINNICDSFNMKNIHKIELKLMIYLLKNKEYKIIYYYFYIRAIKNKNT